MHTVCSQSLFSRPLHLLVALAVLLVPLLGFALPAHAATYTVTNTADSGAGSLRQAILDANGTPEADTITFNTTGTITLQSVLPIIVGTPTINGPGASSLTISGNNAVQVFILDGGSDLTLDGLTIANARGIRTNSGEKALRHCIISAIALTTHAAYIHARPIVLDNRYKYIAPLYQNDGVGRVVRFVLSMPSSRHHALNWSEMC